MRHRQLCLSSIPRGKRWWVGCLLALLVTGKGCADKAEAAAGKSTNEKPAASRILLEFQDSALTARIAAASLQNVLDEISRLSGARIVWLGQRDERQVSVDFTALPFIEALQRLLGPNNFLLMYASIAEGAKLTEIWVSPRKRAGNKSGGESAQIAASLTPMLRPITSEDELMEADSERSLERLLESYLETAARGADHDRRIESISALGGFIDHDPRIRPFLQQLASTAINPQVRTAASEALARALEW